MFKINYVKLYNSNKGQIMLKPLKMATVISTILMCGASYALRNPLMILIKIIKLR